MAKILVVDDEPGVRGSLAAVLAAEGHEVEQATSGEQARDHIQGGAFDVVLTDLKMRPVDGMAVLQHVKEVSPWTEVFVVTGHASLPTAVEAVRSGAYDYIDKSSTPPAELVVKVDKALDSSRVRRELAQFRRQNRERYGIESIIGSSQPIRDVLQRIRRIAATDTTVLITGESGTGKELVARAVHTYSQRADRPFISVNCAAISETLLESELFGHVRGAFTGAVSTRKGLFEEANGGTFFFDEIAETPPSFQAKLLRAIQEGEIRRLGDSKAYTVDVRVIAATNQDLQLAIQEKRFRQDLYYRLNVARFVLPPLRERPEDILLLAQYFVDNFNRKAHARGQIRLAPEVLEYLSSYRYPGNVRELENMIEQGVALAENETVRLVDILPPELGSYPPEPAGSEAPQPEAARLDAPKPPSPESGRANMSLKQVRDEAERRHIEYALGEVNGSREQAAKLLGLSPTTLWRKMKRLGID
ncbi:MAG: sigma-54 dependent transcriptional regulator [Proteobacteria bacterium]|nr:sigma-54 dependent transcriptional regulator [Pseudomonadota bacterium]